LSIREGAMLTPKEMGRIRRYGGGSNIIVTGSYLALGGDDDSPIRLDVHVQDVGSGRSIVSLSESATQKDLLGLVSRTGSRLRVGLGLPGLTATQSAAAAAARQPNERAVRLHAEGLARLRAFDLVRATELFEAAIGEDAGYHAAYSALSVAWQQLGFDAKAREAAENALRSSAGLAREERLLAEARHAEASRDSAAAFRAYEALFRLAPDEIDYGLHLADAQFRTKRRTEALATLAGLERLPPPLGRDPRIMLLRGANAPNPERRRDLTSTARLRALQAGLKFVAARAAVLEAAALIELGDATTGLERQRFARDIYDAGGDRVNLANLLLSTVGELIFRWKLDEAEKTSDRAIATFAQMGHHIGQVQALGQRVTIYRRQGRLALADRTSNEVEELALRTRGPSNEIQRLTLRTPRLWIAAERGQIVEASQEFAELTRGFDSFPRVAVPYLMILRQRGELVKAKALTQDLMADLRQADGARAQWVWPLCVLGGILRATDDLTGARKAYDEAFAVKRGWEVANERAGFAELLLEQGEVAEADRISRETAAFYRAAGAADYEQPALGVQVQVMLQQGRTAEAAEAAERLLKLAESTESVWVGARSRVNGARALAGDPGRAIRLLQDTILAAKRRGYHEIVLEARLIEAQMRTGERQPAASERLAAVARDAERAGFKLIARKARSVSTRGARVERARVDN